MVKFLIERTKQKFLKTLPIRKGESGPTSIRNSSYLVNLLVANPDLGGSFTVSPQLLDSGALTKLNWDDKQTHEVRSSVNLRSIADSTTDLP